MASFVPQNCKRVLEPTPGIGNLVRALERRQLSVTAPSNFWSDIDDTERFDCVVMNPPFSPMKIGYEILDRCMTLTGRIVALMPWLVLINGERRTRRLREFGLVSVTHLPRKTFDGARVQCLILDLCRGHNAKTLLEFAEIPLSE